MPGRKSCAGGWKRWCRPTRRRFCRWLPPTACPKRRRNSRPIKAAVLEQALDGACAVPLEIMEACCEGIALAQEYAAKGSALAVSDAGCAALFCKAAFTGFGPECLHQYQTDGRPRPRRGPERQGRRTAGTVRPAGRYALRKNGNTIERGSLNGNDLKKARPWWRP